MKVSVIVPIYNSEKYLAKCLDSLVNQTLNDYELILINDGSTDNSEDIIIDYAKRFPKLIKNFTKENGGQSSARNMGLTKAKGEYISFVDSDDYVTLDFLEKMYNCASKNNSDICLCNFYIDYGDKIIKNFDYNINTTTISVKKYLLTDPCPSSKIYKKSFLDKINFSFPVGRIYEDYSHIFGLAKYNPKISYVDEYLMYYFQSPQSTMRMMEYNNKFEDIFKATIDLVDFLKDTIYKEELEHIVTYHLLYLSSLNFYKYKKMDMINKISDYMHTNFSNYKKNKYFKKYTIKEKTLCNLFYKKRYKVIGFIQKIKGSKNI